MTHTLLSRDECLEGKELDKFRSFANLWKGVRDERAPQKISKL